MNVEKCRKAVMKTYNKYRSIGGCGLAVASGLALALGGLLASDGHTAQMETSEQSTANRCITAEECFAAAAWPKERLGHTLTKDQVAALKLERLRKVIEGFPATLWAKRAGLLSGVMLIDRNPAGALPYLRAAQRDFLVLDDYIRFWIGEALLRLGDAKEAAGMFEGVPQAVPDSNLLNQVALRAGEAWYQVSSCPEAVAWFVKAVNANDKDPQIAQAWLRLASCYLRENQLTEGRETLKQLWTKFPQTKEAKEAETLLGSNIGGVSWTATPDMHYERAQAFLGQSLHAEAIEELKKFLARDPSSPHRGDAKLKLGIAQVRLKLYDQARETFQALTAEQGPRADEATVWLGRVYLRQGLGEKLLDLCRTLSKGTVTSEQKGQINLFAGIWLEDEARFDEAIARYRQVAKSGEPASQRGEAQWRLVIRRRSACGGRSSIRKTATLNPRRSTGLPVPTATRKMRNQKRRLHCSVSGFHTPTTANWRANTRTCRFLGSRHRKVPSSLLRPLSLSPRQLRRRFRTIRQVVVGCRLSYSWHTGARWNSGHLVSIKMPRESSAR